jgi:sterile alpha motif and leucine zipper-containing kinase AZK
LMRELHHANLVRFFAAQSKPPNLCIVMERMAGSLTDLLYGRLRQGADKTLIAPRLVAIACGIVSGMAFLHAHNVCHRDLKSANVLFDKQLRIKLCDFAFSKFKPSDDNASMQLQTQIGTAAWMAPEVLRGDDYSLKCDSYSFGVIIWELIVRKQPFRELNHFQLLNHVGLQGKTLQMPDDAAPLWRAVASACWESQPQLRPSFAQLDTVFRSAAADLRDGQAKMHAGDRSTGAPIEGSGALLDDGAGMAAWRDVLSALRERVHEQDAEETERSLDVAPAAALP